MPSVPGLPRKVEAKLQRQGILASCILRLDLGRINLEKKAAEDYYLTSSFWAPPLLLPFLSVPPHRR